MLGFAVGEYRSEALRAAARHPRKPNLWHKRRVIYEDKVNYTGSPTTVSMAEAPNPEIFGSWEDAFKYPVAAVRGMERQLRRDIDSNKERLRSLVG